MLTNVSSPAARVHIPAAPKTLITGKGPGGEFLFASFHPLDLQPSTVRGIQSRLALNASRRSAASLT